MKTRDIIIIGAVVVILSFPLMYFVMLLATGNAKLVFKGDLSRAVEIESMARMQRSSQERDSLILAASYAFHAKVDEGERVGIETERMLREQERLEFMIAELQAERERLEAERRRLERAMESRDQNIAQTVTANQRRATDLARVYQAMRPAEAAQIMETLSNNLAVDILRAMTDDRQKARILSAMDTDRAAELSKLMQSR